MPATPTATAPNATRPTATHGSSTRSGIRIPAPTHPFSPVPARSASPSTTRDTNLSHLVTGQLEDVTQDPPYLRLGGRRHLAVSPNRWVVLRPCARWPLSTGSAAARGAR